MDRNALGYLADLNRNVDVALARMEKLAEYPELNNEDFIIYQSYFREYLADTNMAVIDALEASEQEIMMKANRERYAYEKTIRDPDDCYLDVRRREEELRSQGQPSQIGLLLGMRKMTREEILIDPFDGEDEDENDPDMEQEADSNKAQPANNEGRS